LTALLYHADPGHALFATLEVEAFSPTGIVARMIEQRSTTEAADAIARG